MALLAALACLAACLTGHAASDVSITPEGPMHHIQTAVYQATLAEDGALTSLRVGDAEFLAADVSRGGYFYQGGVPALSDIQRPSDGVVLASCGKASARFEFAADRVTVTLSNTTDAGMEYVMVFAPQVNAMRDEAGALRRAPLNRSLGDSTWYRGSARLSVLGSTRVWGPWAGDHQVWTVAIPAREARVVTLDLATATPEEAAAAAEIAAQPVPVPTDPVGPMWDLSRLGQAPAYEELPGFGVEEMKEVFYQDRGDQDVRAISFDGPPFEGRATKVFAWLGMPKVGPGEKVPGIVLVHGGGGTAFAQWVALWTRRGYAAIAIDTCGCVPKGTYGNWQRSPLGGPPGWGGFDQIDQPREDQWTYHAVADAILAHSLLRSLPPVDPARVGLTGISWGGYLTCIIAGADPRFAFAVPVYGCGFTLEMTFAPSVQGLGDERGARWMRWWDPSSHLPGAAMPILWVTGSNDFAYTLNALQKSYRLPTGPRTLAIRLRMPHGHGGVGEDPEEIHAFADSVCLGGDPLARITGQGRDGAQVWATYESARPVVRAELNVTRETGPWPEREWEALPAQLGGQGRVTASLPDGVTVYYFNFFDDRDVAVSTEHVELAP